MAALRAYPDLPAPVPPSPRAAVRGEGAFWGRVPRWAGIVWDAALALLSVLFLCVATDLAFSPEPGEDVYKRQGPPRPKRPRPGHHRLLGCPSLASPTRAAGASTALVVRKALC